MRLTDWWPLSLIPPAWRPPGRFRPQLEALETRCLLSFSLGSSLVVGSAPTSVAVGDFNGDGKPDAAVANFQSGSVSILLGNGDGTFAAAQNIPLDRYCGRVAVGDVNGDGKLDVVASAFPNGSS